MKHKIVFTFLFVVTIAVFFSCKKNPVEPIENAQSGRRDYVWTIDTIDGQGGYLCLYNIWGDSPDNVWISGDNGDTIDRLWKFDGKKWNKAGVPTLWPVGIFGFGKNNLWAASGNEIWHYDGTQWKVNYSAKIEGFSYITFKRFNGSNVNDIWLAGIVSNYDNNEHGVIYHYDGQNWQLKYLTKQNNIQFYKIYPTGKEFLIWGLVRDYKSSIDSSAIFVYDGNENLEEYYKSYYGGYEACWINYINNQIYITFGKTIFKYYKENLSEFVMSKILNDGLILEGRSEKDVFVWEKDGLAHYNGTDIQYIFKQQNSICILDNIIVFDKEIFFFARDRNNNNYYFVKGELK